MSSPTSGSVLLLEHICLQTKIAPRPGSLQDCGEDGQKEKLRLNSNLLSGLLMYSLMSSSMVSLGVQELRVCCRDLGAFISPILENILFAMPACFHSCAAFSETEVLVTLKILAI